LLEALIQKHSNEGDLVLDCFAGSASTAVASYNLNRDFIGCELSKEYFDKAINRLISIGAVSPVNKQ
jgi:site-specific DNA-methyltransferase (adenine-specific)